MGFDKDPLEYANDTNGELNFYDFGLIEASNQEDLNFVEKRTHPR